MSTSVGNPPSAYYLMDSMRSIGYSFDTAVADIIDNSISAKATKIDLVMSEDPSNIYVSFIDNGFGMTSNELIEAMRYGFGPGGKVRADTDLGRFGLGLKSASLSQCRRLTVATNKNGVISAAVWDLDFIEKQNDWSLEILDSSEIDDLPEISRLRANSNGTMVIWQDFDLIRNMNGGQEFKGVKSAVSDCEEYISLIFHRFLSGVDKITITINDNLVVPADPFLESNRKTEIGKTSDISIPDDEGISRHVLVTPYLLPFLKDLSEEDKRKLGGVEKIARGQGFYIYRNNRLIIYGTWFRMSYRSELQKYARIRVDIPSSLDKLWQIDIKKQKAELPPIVKKQLQQYVNEITIGSRRKNEHRLKIVDSGSDSIWQKNRDRDNKSVYRINRNCNLVRGILNSLEPSEASKVEKLLSFIEHTIPYHDLYADEANDNISGNVSDEEKQELVAAAIDIFRSKKVVTVLPDDQLIDKICKIDTFSQFTWFRELFIKELKNGR